MKKKKHAIEEQENRRSINGNWKKEETRQQTNESTGLSLNEETQSGARETRVGRCNITRGTLVATNQEDSTGPLSAPGRCSLYTGWAGSIAANIDFALFVAVPVRTPINKTRPSQPPLFETYFLLRLLRPPRAPTLFFAPKGTVFDHVISPYLAPVRLDNDRTLFESILDRRVNYVYPWVDVEEGGPKGGFLSRGMGLDFHRILPS